LPFRALLAPIAFEACLIIPIVLTLLGIVSITQAVRLRTILVENSLFFLLGAILLFSLSIYGFLKRKNVCTVQGIIKHKATILVSFLTLIAIEGFLLFAIQQTESLTYGSGLVFKDNFNPILFTIGISLVMGSVGVVIVVGWILIKNKVQKK